MARYSEIFVPNTDDEKEKKPKRYSDLFSVEKSGGQSLAEQAKSLLSIPLPEAIHGAVVQEQELLENKYGVDNVEPIFEGKTPVIAGVMLPSGYKVRAKRMGFGGIPKFDIISNEGLMSRVDGEKDKRDNLMNKILDNADTIGPLQRAGIPFKEEVGGEAGIMSYLQELNKDSTVLPSYSRDGKIDRWVVIGKNGKLKVSEGKGTMGTGIEPLGDVLDVGPDIIRTAAPLGAQAATAAITRRVGGKGVGSKIMAAIGTAGDLLAEMTIQGIGQILPGESKKSALERALRSGTNIAFGGVSEVGGQLAAKGIGKLTPSSIVGGKFAGEKVVIGEGEKLAKDIAKEAYDLVKGTNVKLTPGSASLSDSALALEGALRQTVGGRSIFSKFDAENAREIGKTLSSKLNQRFGDGARVTGRQAGTDFALTFDKHLRNMVDITRKDASVEFKNAYKASGNSDVMDMDPFLSEVDKIVSEGHRAGALEPAKKFAKFLGDVASTYRKIAKNKKIAANKKTTAGLVEMPGAKPTDKLWLSEGKYVELGEPEVKLGKGDVKITVREFESLMEDYWRSSLGSQSIISELDRSTNKKYAQRIMYSLRKTLDNAVKNNVKGAESLAKARKIYAVGMSGIDNVRDAVTDKMMDMVIRKGAKLKKEAVLVKNADGVEKTVIREGLREKDLKSPEKIVNAFAGLDRKDKAMFMSAMNSIEPELGDKIAHSYIERLLGSAKPSPGTSLSLRGIEYSPAKLASLIAKKGDDMASVLGPKLGAEIKRIGKLAERISSRAGMTGSQTSPHQEQMKLAKLVSPISWATSPRVQLSHVGLFFAENRLAKIFTDEKKAALFIRALDPAEWTKGGAGLKAAMQLEANLKTTEVARNMTSTKLFKDEEEETK